LAAPAFSLLLTHALKENLSRNAIILLPIAEHLFGFLYWMSAPARS
jgi:hypothetical protein